MLTVLINSSRQEAYINVMGRHWFALWRVACLAPRHCVSQGRPVNWTPGDKKAKIELKKWTTLIRETNLKKKYHLLPVSMCWTSGIAIFVFLFMPVYYRYMLWYVDVYKSINPHLIGPVFITAGWVITAPVDIQTKWHILDNFWKSSLCSKLVGINMSRFGHHCARGCTVICVGLCCPRRVSRARGEVVASCSLLWDAIACPCLRCLPLAAGSSYITRVSANAVLDLNLNEQHSGLNYQLLMRAREQLQ